VIAARLAAGVSYHDDSVRPVLSARVLASTRVGQSPVSFVVGVRLSYFAGLNALTGEDLVLSIPIGLSIAL
jgi:hypothetical protein